MQRATTQFLFIIRHLREAIGGFLWRKSRGPRVVHLGMRSFAEVQAPSPHRPIPDETWRLLLARLNRLATRFETLVRRWQAGALPSLRPGRTRAPRPERAGDPPPPRPRLPAERGWINKRINETANWAGLLNAWLQWPELDRFVREVPRAGRLLRPLCHALGLTLPPALRLPPRPPRPRAAPRPPAPPPLHPPIEAYVLAVARAWKKPGE
jgi:hypothetical protein